MKSHLILLVTFFSPGSTISPFFLWRVINTTIERKKPSGFIDWNPLYCPRLVFHNNETLGSVGEHAGLKSFGFDISGISEQGYVLSNLTEAKTFLADEANYTIFHGGVRGTPADEVTTIRKVYEPCVTVVSIVNGTDLEFDKADIGKQFVELLQYNTPVRNRHLFLVRLGHTEEELFDCTVFRGGSDFPTRRMPLWEMLLFDFFTDARVIQGLVQEDVDKANNALKIGSDPGLWIWLCDDIVNALDRKKQCMEKHSGDVCKIWTDVNDMSVSSDQTCQGGFSPRH